MWSKRIVEHRRNGTARLSVVFTWHLADAYQRSAWLRAEGYRVLAGGPAVALMPEYLSDVAEIGERWTDAVARHNALATFTSRGCVRRCSFCAVPRIEGEFIELQSWPNRQVICDNNLTACSRKHFDRVIDGLKSFPWCDLQGVDARLISKHHALRFAELRNPVIRLGFDDVREESGFLRGWQLLRDAGIPSRRIRVYVLIGYNDTPGDALYRLRLVQSLGTRPNPMRYNPLDAMQRDRYVAPAWTDAELRRYMRYWARLRWFEHIRFEEFRNEGILDLSRSRRFDG